MKIAKGGQRITMAIGVLLLVVQAAQGAGGFKEITLLGPADNQMLRGGCGAGDAQSCPSETPPAASNLPPLRKPGSKPAGTSLYQGPVTPPPQKITTGEVLPAPVTVLPETTTTVQLSSSDLNRIICTSDVKEALTSDEKGLMIKISGRDVFVKYKVLKGGDGALSYSSTPTEIFIVCGSHTYSMIAFPGRMPSQTIKLSSGLDEKSKVNMSMYSGMPFEKKIMKAIKEVFTDSIPESYAVETVNTRDSSWKHVDIVHRRNVVIEGEGLTVKEYAVSLKPGSQGLKLTEKMFMKSEFSLNQVAISIDKHNLRPGETSRLFIVEQKADRPLGGQGLGQIPVLDGASAGGGLSGAVKGATQTVKDKAGSLTKTPAFGK